MVMIGWRAWPRTARPAATAVAVLLAVAVAATGRAVYAEPPTPAVPTAAPATPGLHAEMRALWQGHIAAARNYAVAVRAGDSQEAQAATVAAVANAQQIANTFAGFYGKPAGTALLKLLGGHWAAIQALTDATRARNAADEQAAMGDLAASATAIAQFLGSVNPNWTEGGLRAALMLHVADHHAQIDELMANAPHPEQAKSWAEMQQHMDAFADAFAAGIAAQFPVRAK